MRLNGLSLIFSCDCNLNCSYCVLSDENQKNRCKARTLQAATVQSIEDGSYIKTILDTLKYFNQDPKDILGIDFWGQETTLTLPYFTKHMAEWFEVFPNIHHFLFSTNGTNNNQIIKDFILKVDELGKDVALDIQYSYDGDWPTSTLRGAKPEVIKNNYLDIVDFANNQHYNNITKIHFDIHNVFSYELFHRIKNDDELVLEYEQEFIDLLSKADELNTQHGVVSTGFGTGLQMPYNTSTEEAIEVSNFIKHYLSDSKFVKSRYSPVNNFIKFLQHSGRKIEGGFDHSNEFISKYLTSRDKCSECELGMYCGNCYSHIKIMYDGTILGCQSFMFNLEEVPETNPDTLVMDAINNSEVRHHHHIKVTDPKEYIDNNLELSRIEREDSFQFAMHQVMSMMLVLSRAGQIDSIYQTDKKRLVEDAFYLSTKNVCAYNYIASTGSNFMKDIGYIKLFCNGIMDIIRQLNVEERQNELQNRRK